MKDWARRGLGSGKAGRTCSQRVKLSLKHKTLSPHPFFFVRSPSWALNNRVNRNPKRSILTSET